MFNVKVVNVRSIQGCLVTAAATLASFLAGCSLMLKDQDVTERLRMHAGTTWLMGNEMPSSLTAEEQEVMSVYFLNKEISLGASSLGFSEPLGGVNLTLVNQGLSCGRPDDPNRRRCRDTEYFNLPEPGRHSTPENCRRLMPTPSFGYTNFYGVLQHRGKNFCVYVRLSEGSWPKKTRIDRDIVFVTVRYEKREGDAGAGGLAGGPRVNY